ncbi:hypothetical protein M2337_000976 [Sphingobium sp. B2D3A]|uniref:hypothetical protein n=1 Tax=unclassified Sphingobium TaxID=2611147 RepID=UPI00222450F3|nr:MULTISPECIES: hypothetical protein [unclassified Sphingobium]MCW2336743.1 hypothetical protein [Sphingobium sp. B2D3A]MCW2386497.1 hypothetical protein [Sphingobium sp. B2D3D]
MSGLADVRARTGTPFGDPWAAPDVGQPSLARGVVMGAPVSLLLWWLLLQLVVRVAS